MLRLMKISVFKPKSLQLKRKICVRAQKNFKIEKRTNETKTKYNESTNKYFSQH